MIEAACRAIDEQPWSRLKRERTKKYLRKVYRTGGLSAWKKDPVWAYRICAANLSMSNYSWWGWECRSDWAWDHAQKSWFYPKWDGKDKKLLVVAEQGLGDEILFLSVADRLSKDVSNITWELDDRLLPIARRSFPHINFVTRWRGEVGDPLKNGDHRGEFEAYIPAASLLTVYINSRKDIPGKPYLVPKEREKRGGIGYSWRGGKDKERYVDPEILEGTVNLQYDDPGCEEIDDFDEHISLIASLDGVNTIPTSLVHICGAIGQKCNVIRPPQRVESNLIRWEFNWRERRMDWYESVSLYPSLEAWRHTI